MTGGFPSQMASNAESVSIPGRHHIFAIDVPIRRALYKHQSDVNPIRLRYALISRLRELAWSQWRYVSDTPISSP